MNATPPPVEPHPAEARPETRAATPGTAGETLAPDQARQGEVVFAKPWKRQLYFALVAAVAAIGLVLIIAFT